MTDAYPPFRFDIESTDRRAGAGHRVASHASEGQEAEQRLVA